MSEGDEENDSDRVKPLEAKPGGKEDGTVKRLIASAMKEEDKE